MQYKDQNSMHVFMYYPNKCEFRENKAQIGEGLQWLPGLLSEFTCFLQGTY